uniref:Uncharacterized protein n=1 Tax=Cacopsylla melanoneura TaxID=428564 RepID=A0A8D8QZQ4_9HEMI
MLARIVLVYIILCNVSNRNINNNGKKYEKKMSIKREILNCRGWAKLLAWWHLFEKIIRYLKLGPYTTYQRHYFYCNIYVVYLHVNLVLVSYLIQSDLHVYIPHFLISSIDLKDFVYGLCSFPYCWLN